MTPDAALARTGLLIFLLGFCLILAAVALLAPDVKPRAGGLTLAMGLALILVAFGMWIASIWMQVG